MDDLPTTAVSSDSPQPQVPSGLTRREFLQMAALLGGGAMLLLTRCRAPFLSDENGLPTIPPEFKRFLLVAPSSDTPEEKRIVALGSQCPDLACALWWADTQAFQFFDSVEQIVALYTWQGDRELLWID
jgi:hypothetical protein